MKDFSPFAFSHHSPLNSPLLSVPFELRYFFKFYYSKIPFPVSLLDPEKICSQTTYNYRRFTSACIGSPLSKIYLCVQR